MPTDIIFDSVLGILALLFLFGTFFIVKQKLL